MLGELSVTLPFQIVSAELDREHFIVGVLLSRFLRPDVVPI